MLQTLFIQAFNKKTLLYMLLYYRFCNDQHDKKKAHFLLNVVTILSSHFYRLDSFLLIQIWENVLIGKLAASCLTDQSLVCFRLLDFSVLLKGNFSITVNSYPWKYIHFMYINCKCLLIITYSTVAVEFHIGHIHFYVLFTEKVVVVKNQLHQSTWLVSLIVNKNWIWPLFIKYCHRH